MIRIITRLFETYWLVAFVFARTPTCFSFEDYWVLFVIYTPKKTIIREIVHIINGPFCHLGSGEEGERVI
jgi:hypothetical protein